MKTKMLRTSLSILMTLVIMLSTVGCSIDELQFYSLSKEIDQMKVMDISGVVSVELGSELLKEIPNDNSPEMKIVEDLLASGFDIKYTAKMAKDPLAYEIKIDFRKKGETNYKKITTIIGDDKLMYFNMKDSLTFLKPYILATKPSEEKVINALIAKVDYLQVDLSSENSTLDYNAQLSESEELSRIITEFTDILKEAYSSYSSETVHKKGNGYELKLEAKDIKPLIIKFAEYTITNIDAIIEKLSAKVNSMPEKDIAILGNATGDSNLGREKLLSSIEEYGNTLKIIAPAYIEEMKNDESVDEVFESIEGSVFSNYVEKENSNSYKATADFVAKYENKMFFTLKDSAQIKKLDTFSITKPSNVTTVEDMESIVKSALPVSVDTIKINLKTKKTIVTYSDKKTSSVSMPYQAVKGYTFISLDAANKALGTQISWDAKKQTGLVKKDGKTIELAAAKVSGKTYVKTADLEKLGYIVWYDTKTGEINIKNMTKQSIFQ